MNAPDAWGLVIMTAAEVVLIIHSFFGRLAGLSENISIGALLVLCAAFAAGYFASDLELIQMGSVLKPYMFGATAAALLIYFGEMHFTNVDETLDNVNEMLNQPEVKIRRFNNRILWVFLAGTAVIAALAVIFRLDKAVIAFFQGLLAVIRFLISLIPEPGNAPSSESFPEESFTPGEKEDWNLEPGEASNFWLFLEYVLIVAVVIAAVAGVIYGLYRFYKWYYSRKPDLVTSDDYEETSTYIEKKSTAFATPGVSLLERLRLSPEKRVRRIYRKRLQTPMRQGELKPSDTPGEILTKLPSEDLEVLSDIYEKARYSEEGVTREDVRKING